eukprot:g34665.t1
MYCDQRHAPFLAQDHSHTVECHSIHNNINLVCDVIYYSQRAGLSSAFLSLGQEKVFNAMDHQYLLGTLPAENARVPGGLLYGIVREEQVLGTSGRSMADGPLAGRGPVLHVGTTHLCYLGVHLCFEGSWLANWHKLESK